MGEWQRLSAGQHCLHYCSITCVDTITLGIPSNSTDDEANPILKPVLRLRLQYHIPGADLGLLLPRVEGGRASAGPPARPDCVLQLGVEFSSRANQHGDHHKGVLSPILPDGDHEAGRL